MNTNKMIFIRCCYGYSISGMAVLVVGAVLPSLMSEGNLNYSLAGGALSMMAIGNLLSSFLFPALVGAWGMRRAITMTSFLVPVCMFSLTLLPSVTLLYLIMLAAGLARGCVTIINNNSVNVISNSSGKSLNLLHCSFATGAFLAPFITAFLMYLGFGWRSVLYLITVLSFTSALSYSTICYDSIENRNGKDQKKAGDKPSSASYLKSFDFYCLGILLFFYLGTENCINGWFVTYLQGTGVMSDTYATSMVSVTWVTILIGRLICASLSKKYKKGTLTLVNAVGSSICLVILLSSTHLVTITAALVGLGLFLAGICPTCLADAGQYIQGSTAGMSLLTAIYAVGGILTPQIIGMAADRIGMTAAFGILAVNAVLMVIMAVINFLRSRNRPLIA